MTDLVVTTCDRLALLKRTLAYIWERTRTPYHLHVVDDASTEGNARYLRELWAQGRVSSVHLHHRRVGIVAHLRTLTVITTSDPVVLTDDDVLCPQVDPDWLSRGLAAMVDHSEVGILALNNPHCNVRPQRGETEPAGAVTYCRNVGGTYAFIRRAVLEQCVPAGSPMSPMKALCAAATVAGWRVAYLTDTYCQHIGAVSVRARGRRFEQGLSEVQPVNMETLEPPDAYKG